MSERISARALVLTPMVLPGGEAAPHVTLAIELPDGRTAIGKPFWIYRKHAGVIDVGSWVPITMPADKPDKATLEENRVPTFDEVAAIIAEALGGPPVPPGVPDELRISLALRYANRIIALGGLPDAVAAAIRERIQRGI